MLLKLLITIDFDQSEFFDSADEFQKEWFYEDVLSSEDNNLVLHSNELGEAIGKVIGCEVVPDSKSELKRIKIQKDEQ